jgi:integrase
MPIVKATQPQRFNSSKSIKLDELLSAYLEYQVLRPATKRCYKTVIHVLVKDNSIEYINEVTEAMLIEWRRDVLERAAAATWNNYHTHLRVLWNFALKKKWINDNIFLSVSKVTAPHLKKKTISVSSLKMMLDTMGEYEDNFEPKWFWVVLVKLFYYTGMRRHQILNLKWKDIDFLTHTIFLSVGAK